MSIPIETVPRWWILDGLGHALRAETDCDCGECRRYTAICGMASNAGRTGEAVPGRICTACRCELARGGTAAAAVRITARIVRADEIPPELARYLRGAFGGAMEDG